MAIKWAWGFSTDQSRAKLEAIGWAISHAAPTISTTETHTYPGDNVSKRASLRFTWNNYSAYSPPGTAPLNGWIACSAKGDSGGAFQWGTAGILGVHENGLTGIYVDPSMWASSLAYLRLYVDNTYKAQSTLQVSASDWNYYAIKYEGSTTTFKATLYVNGVEYIAEQTDTASTAWSDLTLMRMWVTSHTSSTYTYFGNLVAYDDITDAGQTEVWCSTYEPQTDDAETGTWAPSTGATNFGVVTPWDTATYTEETSPSTDDKFTCGFTDSIATHLGISPTIHAVVSQAAVSGGSAFKALLDVGAGDVVGTSVTSNVSNPTYGYSTETTGITASSTVKVGIKIP